MRIVDAVKPNRSSGDDPLLMSRIASGDHAAVAALYDRYAPLVMALARRILHDQGLVEDLLEEVFVELWQRADRFDASRGSVATYIATLTRSRAIDRLRSERRTAGSSLADAPEPTGPLLSPEIGLVQEDRRTQVMRALQELSADQRQAIELAYYSNLSHAEIAQRLAKPLGTVKTWIRQGLIRLRDCLRTPDGEAGGGGNHGLSDAP